MCSVTEERLSEEVGSEDSWSGAEEEDDWPKMLMPGISERVKRIAEILKTKVCF